MRFHVLGIPHTITHPDWSGCAFTQKVAKFLKMMSGRGHTLIHYGHQDSLLFDSPDIEHVPVTDNALFQQAYGEYDWRTNGFAHYYEQDTLVGQVFCNRTIAEIAIRKQPHDFLLCFWGWGHKPIADAHPDMICVEPGIGYPSAFARWRVYESHTIRNAFYGTAGVSECTQDFYDVVIPNYFDEDDFDFGSQKADYILYLGRVGYNKGVDIAIDATAHAGKRIVIAGQGTLAQMGYSNIPDHVTEIGYAPPALRTRALQKAESLIIASRYLEPFGGVQVEAWLSGTPVISPDYGAFAELNEHGKTGFRCRTMNDFVRGVKNAHTLSPEYCRSYAEQFTLNEIAPQYERYFRDVLNVYQGAGWTAVEGKNVTYNNQNNEAIATNPEYANPVQ